jgi:hypothetical protein
VAVQIARIRGGYLRAELAEALARAMTCHCPTQR